jgi:hypothetical protein
MRVALVSVATGRYISAHASALRSKQCYALNNEYTFVLETSEMMHGRVQHWNRVFAIQKLLPYFDW